tara:strand:+ start:3550 stop:4008 length:459 start_codon:yes stop_codon:yes gene_type:complete
MGFSKLNFPNIELKTKLTSGILEVFDVVRNKYVKLTSEEWVRQHCINYLHMHKQYPYGLMSVEKVVKYNNLSFRADIVIYDNLAKPYMIVECKSPDVNLSKNTLYQIAKYNSSLSVKYLLITNGLVHYCCEIDYKSFSISLIKNIPNFNKAH